MQTLAYQCKFGGECTACGECAGDGDGNICPVCGEECEELYRDLYGDIVGCDKCIRVEQAASD